MLTSTELNLKTFRVLVVEDNFLLCQMLVEILEHWGATCTVFETAKDALIDVLGGYVPDLLITGHLVPGQINGAELAVMLAVRCPGLPTVLTSGYGSEVRNDLPSAVVVLPKPWLPETLEDAVRRALEAPAYD